MENRQVAELSQIEVKAIKDLEDTINRDRADGEIVLIAYRDPDRGDRIHRQSASINPT
ncbi:MAG: hypothetical protein ACM3X4_11955 [Ignavibacteriales bacterium]